MKRLALFVAVVFVAAACSSTDQASQAVTETTSAPAPDGTGTTVTEEGTPDGPLAPDFTMALRSGGNFTLSEESKPVYMIFWAEW
jgi:ABC-type glycerol-3-phosphate transport system substrate-binding protein